MLKKLTILLLSMIFLGALSFAQSEEIVLQFSNPDQPGTLKAHLNIGGVTVKGHDSNDIIIRFSNGLNDEEEVEMKNGLRRIRAAMPQLEVEENNNHVQVISKNWKNAFDINILVPYETSLSLKCINKGNIVVENVKGELEAHNINGAITLRDIAGSVVAHTINKNLSVSFTDLDEAKPMSFTSLNGDVDITFPENLKAKLILESNQGDIFTAFDVELKQNVTRKNDKGDGRRRISYKSQMVGIVGGGGPEMTLKSYNGDIFIRKP